MIIRIILATALLTVPALAKDNNPFSGAMSIDVSMHKVETGRASWYGSESGNRTASGEHFNPDGLTAAHRTRPIGSFVTVTNQRNGKSVRVRINDRGPARWTGRVIDLSAGAARVLGMINSGVVPVTID